LRTDQEEAARPVPIQIAPDGLGFRIAADAEPAWTITRSGEYWFEVTDEAGLTGTGAVRWSIRAVQDEPPSVVLEKPAGNAFVAADAVLHLQGVVKDDLALRSITLAYRRGDSAQDQPMQTIPLFEGPDQPRAGGRAGGVGSLVEQIETIDYRWDLSQLPGVQPGLWIDFELVAADYRPQQERSATRRLTIISVGELEERIAARRSFILGQLAEVLRVQREVRSQTRAVEIGWEEQQALLQQDVDRLQSAELRQRQVGQLLAGPGDGVQAQITALLDELRSNRIESSEVYQRMNDLLNAVQQISSEQLPEIQRELIDLSKAARELLHNPDRRSADDPVAVEPALIASLQSAGRQQDTVIAALESLLGDFTQWDSYRRFSRELTRLRQAQEEVLQETERLRLEHLAQQLRELSPEQRANLRRTGQRQAELGREFTRIQSRMEQMQAELVEDDAAAAETLADALNTARRNAVGGRMRDCGRRIEENQLGDAVQTQRALLDHLQELIDTLVNRREHELGRRADQLREAEADLEELRQQQQQLQQRLEQAAALEQPEQRRSELDRLQAPQRELAEQARRLARQLERLRTQQPAASVGRAAAQLEQSAEAAARDDGGRAIDQAHQAERSLEEARQQLGDERRNAEQELAQEQLTRLSQLIRELQQRQQSVQQTTLEYEQLRLQPEQWSRAQSISVGRLAGEQRLLATGTTALIEQVAGSQVLALGLQGAARPMDRAAQGLECGETGSATQQAQQLALTRLGQLLQALQQEPGAEDPPPGDGDQGNQPSLAEALQRLAELKLLRLMQQDVNQQTAELETLRQSTGQLNDEQRQRLDELSAEQGRLAELMLNLATQ
jgi:hypothetical protein